MSNHGTTVGQSGDPKTQTWWDWRQACWDRGVAALDMRVSGMTYRAIAEHYGVTNERARQIVGKAERQRRWGHRPPVERMRLVQGDWRQP